MIFAEARLGEHEQAFRAAALSSRFESKRLYGVDDAHDFEAPAVRSGMVSDGRRNDRERT